jgi:hypothetical protein
MKKLMLALAALGLAAGSVPATAEQHLAPRVDFSVRIGQPRDWRNDQNFYNYYESRNHYRNYPRCKPWEVAIRNPYRPNRWICIEREHYNTYWRHDGTIDRFRPYSNPYVR